MECVENEDIVRGEPELLAGCDHAARLVAGEMETVADPDAAALLIRALAAWGDPEALSEALDRSLALVPAGEFVMGSREGRPDEEPERRVDLSGFRIGRFEVANAQYARFLAAAGRAAPRYWDGAHAPAGQGDFPVVGVSWESAAAFCEWSGGRLPTEAEWEKACRGEDGRTYPWGDAWEIGRLNLSLGTEPAEGSYLDQLWPLLESPPAGGPGLRPVGSIPGAASPFGVMDLAGNAAEWVADWYNWGGAWGLPARDPVGTGPAWNRSVRGSGWFFRMGMEAEAAQWSRCSARNSSHSSDDPRVGFRCAYPER